MDEDGPEDDDFNLINPKFTKNGGVNMLNNGVKKIKKMQSGLGTGSGTGSGSEKPPSTESKSTKMKYWKIDFYRDQDRTKMNQLIKKLMHHKEKPASKSSKGNHKSTSSKKA